MLIRAVRTSSRFANAEKIKTFQAIDEYVLCLKNRMSKYVHENIQSLQDDTYDFRKKYPRFNSKTKLITPWETQTIFNDICIAYNNCLEAQYKKLDTKIQTGVKVTHYKKKVTLKNGVVKNKGDVKSYKITKGYNDLGRIVKLLTYLDMDNLYLYCDCKFYKDLIAYKVQSQHWDRIVTLARSIRQRLMSKIKCIQYTTGSYRMNLKGDEVVFDDSNKKFKYWFKYKDHQFPLLLERDEYHKNFDKINKSKNKQVTIKVVGDRIDFIFSNEYKPVFKKQDKIIGLDLNIKRNFYTTSERMSFDYDRKYIQEFIDKIKTFDAVGYQNLTKPQKAELKKLVARNEFYFKALVSKTLDPLAKSGVTDIVMEDFDSNTFISSFIGSNEFGQRYTRLIRLLRLGNIKKWMIEQAQKRGIRVHITPAPYSSQECPECHYIDHLNRTTQEEFSCVECKFTDDADFVSPRNLKFRLTSDVLRNALHTQDDYGRLIPKKLSRESLLKVLSSFSPS